MPFHSSSSLDAAFSTTHGAAYTATVSESEVDDYEAPCIPVYNREVIDEDIGIAVRVATLEFRKADLNTPASGLARGTTVTVNGKTHTIQELFEESTYTYKYVTSS